MPSAKPAYDSDGGWKHRQFEPTEWEALAARLRSKLRPLYPDKDAEVTEPFGHPAEAWANALLSDAYGAVSAMLSLRRRLSNEELRAERQDLLNVLNRAVDRLGTVSRDLDVLFGIDADVLGTRDKLQELLPFIEAAESRIADLPRAMNKKDAESAAALEMAIRCLRTFQGEGGKISGTVHMDMDYISTAVKMLKILGDELGLELNETTWKAVIARARKAAPDLR